MAIDTEKKRRASASVPFPWANNVMPDNNIDETDRAVAAGSYYSGEEVELLVALLFGTMF